MRELIDALKVELNKYPELTMVRIESFGDLEEMPEFLPYLNINPESNNRERVPLIGGYKVYEEFPKVVLHVWETDFESLGKAFDKCEALTETILEILAGIDKDDLGLKYHEEGIEKYDEGLYDEAFVSRATIMLEGRKQRVYFWTPTVIVIGWKSWWNGLLNFHDADDIAWKNVDKVETTYKRR